MIPPRTRKPKVSPTKLALAVSLAVRISVHEAARQSGISARAIRDEMNRLGIPRRRCGNFTLQEIYAMKAKA